MHTSRTIFSAYAPAVRLKAIPWEVNREFVVKLTALARDAELAFLWAAAIVTQAMLPYRPLAFPAAVTALVGLAVGFLYALPR